jgi:hypothetical protein
LIRSAHDKPPPRAAQMESYSPRPVSNREFQQPASAFSSKVDAGLRRENATKQRDRVPFRFNRNEKGSEALLRKAAARTVEELWQVIASALDAFTPQECGHYLAACG